MMSIPPYTSIVAGLQRTRTTDLDRYVRAEFGDRDGAWLADGVRTNLSNRGSKGLCMSRTAPRIATRLAADLFMTPRRYRMPQREQALLEGAERLAIRA